MNTGNGNRIARIADLLDRAQAERAAVDPITVLEPSIRLDEAYEIQMKNVARALRRGAAITGKKIGLTSRAMQQLIGVDEPDYGHLLDTMDRTGKEVPVERLIQPKVEGEIAFLLKTDLRGPGITAADVLRATASVMGAIEIVDSRVRDWKIGLIDTVADNASSGMYMLGDYRYPPAVLALPRERMNLYKNGALMSQGTGMDVLGDPAACVAWLANKLCSYGVTLQAGEVILSGALTAAVPAERGDCFEVLFSNLGKVTARFV